MGGGDFVAEGTNGIGNFFSVTAIAIAVVETILAEGVFDSPFNGTTSGVEKNATIATIAFFKTPFAEKLILGTVFVVTYVAVGGKVFSTMCTLSAGANSAVAEFTGRRQKDFLGNVGAKPLVLSEEKQKNRIVGSHDRKHT